MRQIDQPHDAEDQRQAGGEQRVEPAEQHALDDDVEERGHRRASLNARNTRRGSPSRDSVVRAQPGQRHAALRKAVDAVRHLHRLDDVLLDHDDRGALRLDRRKRGIDVADDHRREAERDLVAEQQLRVGHQRAADRHHLLLAARQRHRRVVAPFAEDREQLVERLQRPAPGAGAAVAADQQILLDAERREQPAAFRHHGDAALHDVGRRQPADRLALETDRLARRRQHAGDGLQEGRLAGAVGADDGDGLAWLDCGRDAEQRLEVAVEGIEVFDGKQRHRAAPHTGEPR